MREGSVNSAVVPGAHGDTALLMVAIFHAAGRMKENTGADPERARFPPCLQGASSAGAEVSRFRADS